MQVIRKNCMEGAREAEGVVVVIDVFRAFTCAPLFFHFGAERVILEADPDRAMDLKRSHPEYILLGEVNEAPIEGGDLGNSPTHVIQKGTGLFRGKTVIHRTTAGVVGVNLVHRRAEMVILGSFVMAKAIASYLQERRLATVILLAMGSRGMTRAAEDEACADYLEHLLTGSPYNPVQVFHDVVFDPVAQRFLAGTKDYLPKEDVVFCLQRDLFDVVLVVKERHGRLEAVKAEGERSDMP